MHKSQNIYYVYLLMGTRATAFLFAGHAEARRTLSPTEQLPLQ